jgi:protein gp37
MRDQCLAKKIAFFFKQWGGVNKKANGRTLENRTWDEKPKNEQYSKWREITRDRCTGVLS